MTEPLFTTDGDTFVPSEHVRGPWDPGAMHGGAPSALIARVMESLPTEVPMAVVRFTVDILKPIPIAPVRIAARIERPGKRVQLVSAMLSAGGDEICRAVAWKIRVGDIDMPVTESVLPFPGPDAGQLFPPESDQPAFHRTGVQLRFVRGTFWDVGPCTVWIRLQRPVLDGEEPSPVMRVLAAADFGNGVSSALEWGRYVYVNTDLTAYLFRPPTGDWICLDAISHVSTGGSGVADCELYDVDGPIGRSLQALYVDRLAGATEAGS